MAAAAFREVQRARAADRVFEQLARAILQGELRPGEPLPAERVLADEFGVSRIIVRQAVHRLAELGLVRVRQGGASIVLDPDQASDIRLIGLYYQLDLGADQQRLVERDIIEKQFLQGLTLTNIANRRASDEERRALVALVAELDPERADDATFRRFEADFWRLAAHAGKNRILKMEVAWWYDNLAQPPREPTSSGAPMALRVAFYRELAERIAHRDDPSGYYLRAVSPLLDALMEPS